MASVAGLEPAIAVLEAAAFAAWLHRLDPVLTARTGNSCGATENRTRLQQVPRAAFPAVEPMFAPRPRTPLSGAVHHPGGSDSLW